MYAFFLGLTQFRTYDLSFSIAKDKAGTLPEVKLYFNIIIAYYRYHASLYQSITGYHHARILGYNWHGGSSCFPQPPEIVCIHLLVLHNSLKFQDFEGVSNCILAPYLDQVQSCLLPLDG